MSEAIVDSFEAKVARQHTALVVVDVQNDFCAPGGYYGRTGADVGAIHDAVSRLQGLLEAARSGGVMVVFVRAVYDDVFLSPVQKERHRRRFGEVMPCCVSGTWGAEFFEVHPRPNELIVDKHRYSAFVGTELDLVLRAQGIKTLVLAGVATNVCVDSTARDAYMRDYYVVVVDDCTAARTDAFHRSALANIELAFGAVVNSQAVAGAWTPAPAAGLTRGA